MEDFHSKNKNNSPERDPRRVERKKIHLIAQTRARVKIRFA